LIFLVERRFHVIIIGSGAAGLNCACALAAQGIDPKQIAIFTEDLTHGTSFDAGSDKQTYYKLSTIGSVTDTPTQLAHTLYDGGAMHGDIALIEATGSIQGFMHLVSIGVPFPHDLYGGFVGYKTDNDVTQRGTSAGPETSKLMCTKLLDEVRRYGIMIFNQQRVIRIIKDEHGAACGILTLYKPVLEHKPQISGDVINQALFVYQADFVVLATGGPASLYEFSAYPTTQWGGTGLVIEAGCWLQNLTESQYGIASLPFRWNMS
jgi:succinate dehydrogenase/fumarate reductase flavoprotein subunit